MKWYGVYGNHDYGQLNRDCACSGSSDVPGRQCAQVQKHGFQYNQQEWCAPLRPPSHPISRRSIHPSMCLPYVNQAGRQRPCAASHCVGLQLVCGRALLAGTHARGELLRVAAANPNL